MLEIKNTITEMKNIFDGLRKIDKNFPRLKSKENKTLKNRAGYPRTTEQLQMV